jgi:outer membrane protein assembly factor BamB
MRGRAPFVLAALVAACSGGRARVVEAPSSLPAPDEARPSEARRTGASAVWRTLAPAPESNIAGAWDVQALRDSFLVAQSSHLRRLAPPSKQSLATRTISGLTVRHGSPVAPLATEGVIVAVRGLPRSLVGIDAETLTDRWSLSLSPAVNVAPFDVAGTSDVLVIKSNQLGSGQQTTGTVRAVDARNGTLLWQKQLPLTTDVFAAGGRAFISHIAAQSTPEAAKFNFVAAHIRSGQVLWELPQRVDAVFANERWLAVAGDRKIQLLDPSTGKEVRAIALAGSVSSDQRGVLVDDILYVHVAPEEKLASGGVYAYDLSTGKELWKASRWGAAILDQGSTVLRVHGDVLLACADDGSANVIDRSSGETLWSWGLDRCRDIAAAHDSPTVYVAKGAFGDSALTAFAPGDKPEEHVTVSGRVVLGDSLRGFGFSKVHVRVGDVETRPDAAGNFRAQLDARGKLPISAVLSVARQDPKCDDSAANELRVELTGKAEYEVTLNLELRCR